MALFYFIARAQPHQEFTRDEDYTRTMLRPSEARVFVDAVSVRRQEPIPLTIDHANLAYRGGEIVPMDLRIGQVLFSFLDGQQNVMIAGELWPGPKANQILDDVRQKRKQWGVSFWTEYAGTAKNATALIITHVGITERPSWGPDGSWIFFVFISLVALRRALRERYLSQHGAYFSAITLQELRETEFGDQNLYTQGGGMGELKTMSDDAWLRSGSFFTSVVPAMAEIIPPPATPPPPAPTESSQQPPQTQQVAPPETPPPSRAPLTEAQKATITSKLHAEADAILSNHDIQGALQYNDRVGQLMTVMNGHIFRDAPLMQKLTNVSNFAAEFYKKSVPAEHAGLFERVVTAPMSDIKPEFKELLLGSAKQTYSMHKKLEEQGAAIAATAALNSQRDLELAAQKEKFAAMEARFAKIDEEAAAAKKLAEAQKQLPSRYQTTSATGATASLGQQAASQLRPQTGGGGSFGGASMNELLSDYMGEAPEERHSRWLTQDTWMSKVQANQKEDGVSFYLPEKRR